MEHKQVKFIFIKTPQVRHRFMTSNGNQFFPVTKDEIYQAKLVGEIYEFFGRSFSGAVTEEDFRSAIEEGFISIVNDW